MTGRFGIDTSVLLRLTTTQPPEEFARCVRELQALYEGGSEIVASNQVIGEAYVAAQHHYGVTKFDARESILGVFESGLVSPLNGDVVLDILRASGGSGLVDRLIVDGYRHDGLETLTLDRRMANLSRARLL